MALRGSSTSAPPSPAATSLIATTSRARTVIGPTKSLRKEVAGKSVIVNAITPAIFESPNLAQLPQRQVDYSRAKIRSGRLGKAEESAAMACFMASEEGNVTTAAAFDTTGGRATF